jgi:hypothetical protein
VALASVLVLAACGAETNETSFSNQEHPFATYARSGPPGEGDSAMLEGELVLEGGCLYVREPSQELRWLPVLPNSAQWDAESRVLTLDDVTVAVGEEIGLVGGVLDDQALVEHLPEGCDLPSPTSTPGEESHAWLTMALRK